MLEAQIPGPYTPREIVVPDQHPAYSAAHYIADMVVDASLPLTEGLEPEVLLRRLVARANVQGFEPSNEIFTLAHQIGSLIDRHPDLKTPWHISTLQ